MVMLSPRRTLWAASHSWGPSLCITTSSVADAAAASTTSQDCIFNASAHGVSYKRRSLRRRSKHTQFGIKRTPKHEGLYRHGRRCGRHSPCYNKPVLRPAVSRRGWGEEKQKVHMASYMAAIRLLRISYVSNAIGNFEAIISNRV